MTERKRKEVTITSGPSAFSYLDSYTPLQFVFVHLPHRLVLMCACRPNQPVEDLPGMWEGSGTSERRSEWRSKELRGKIYRWGNLTGLLNDKRPHLSIYPLGLYQAHIFDQVALVVKSLLANAGDVRDNCFKPWVGEIPWRRKWQPTLVFLPGKSHGQRSLVGYSPWSWKESDTTEGLSTCIFDHCMVKEFFLFLFFSLYTQIYSTRTFL